MILEKQRFYISFPLSFQSLEQRPCRVYCILGQNLIFLKSFFLVDIKTALVSTLTTYIARKLVRKIWEMSFFGVKNEGL